MGFKHTDECLAKAKPNEPIFVVRAQDMFASELVRDWADKAAEAGCRPEKVAEARELADAMDRWPVKKYPD